MRHPHPKDRAFWAVACGLLSIACVAAACTIHALCGGFRWSEAPLEAFQLALGLYLVMGPAVLLGGTAIGVARGPDAQLPRVVHSEAWGSLFPMSMAAAVCGLLALRVLAQTGDLGSIPLPGQVGFSALAALGVGLALGVVSGAWKLLIRGPASVLLSGCPLLAGDEIECVLELPFAAATAPEIEARLELVMSGATSTDHDSTKDKILWSQRLRARDWLPSGRRRCRTPLRFTLPCPDRRPDLDLGWSSAHIWQLEAKSISMPAFHATFLMPIAIRNPASEGIVRA